MNTINAYIIDLYYQSIDFTDFEIKILIDNDMKEDVLVTAYSVYVNEKSYPFDYTTVLKQRDKLELKISEVLQKAVVDSDNSHAIFCIDN